MSSNIYYQPKQTNFSSDEEFFSEINRMMIQYPQAKHILKNISAFIEQDDDTYISSNILNEASSLYSLIDDSESVMRINNYLYDNIEVPIEDYEDKIRCFSALEGVFNNLQQI